MKNKTFLKHMEFNFTICNPKNSKKHYVIALINNVPWIEKEDGEGTSFDEAKLFEVIDKFYNDNF